MHTASRFEFDTPQPRQGLLRAYGLALLIHGLLAAALTWGVNWRSSDTSLSVEAELWSAVPQQAAPRLVEPEPEPAPEPTPPPPPPKVEEPRQSEADIALAREKERQAKEKLEQARLEREKLAREKQEREKLEREKKLAEEKKRKELEEKQARLKEQKETEQREKLRQENLKRMAGLAGATGAPNATGTAQKSSGISSSYAGRIRARIKPNIVFPNELATNPSAEVEVRTSPDGTIVGRKLLKSSGVPSWDEAVLKAIDKTDTLPRNEEGVVPSPMTIIFRPKD
ncbi:cell envelope integrity protein TolA [Rhodoferax sp. BAB1]|uniref:cell envelope integrity protein TolA n=1 Tax=Rhodoferax sp. BAB1 TaxID=2741720 RepID=UPI001575B617|nr:cell envelope integrity protein TolA [Rhodoferax sp. BAB1]QKO22174.1 cell envelope integrity protein TolA [Rhodoferax sp. BAB1]